MDLDATRVGATTVTFFGAMVGGFFGAVVIGIFGVPPLVQTVLVLIGTLVGLVIGLTSEGTAWLYNLGREVKRWL